MQRKQDSWKRRGSAAGETQTPQPHCEADRYKHDIEQANAMRKRSSTRINAKTSTSSEKDVVALGLRGLEEADALREQGHLKSALELYQSAIEVLIRYLKEPAQNAYDLGAIGARVSVALSEAENLKEVLRKDERKQKPSESPAESPTSKTCLSRIKAYLSSVQTTSSFKGGNVTTPTGTRKSAVPNSATKPISPRSSTANNAAVSTGQNLSQKSTTVANSASTNKNNNKQSSPRESDALTQSVMDDMYIPPSKMQAITWGDIAGLKQAKQALQEAAIMPLLRPDLFTGLRKPQNILLYGPPGTGKTMLIKAVAHESQCNLFVCTASALTSKWHGEGEKLLRELFRVANESAPAIVFLDEIDALLSARKSEGEHEASRRFKTEFMVQMDSILPNSNAQVLVIACTNCPWDIDNAIMRRFPKRIFVPLPDKSARKVLFKSLLKKAGKHSLTSGQISELVSRLKGFSGSDMQAIASEAAFGPLRLAGGLDAIRQIKAKDVRPISMEDFENALKFATKSVSKELLKRYDKWNEQQAA